MYISSEHNPEIMFVTILEKQFRNIQTQFVGHRVLIIVAFNYFNLTSLTSVDMGSRQDFSSVVLKLQPIV